VAIVDLVRRSPLPSRTEALEDAPPAEDPPRENEDSTREEVTIPRPNAVPDATRERNALLREWAGA
jgi:hypothetical protein